MKTKERETKNKGITLIALVVTIIVLLILAGVTIATLTGDNGILTKATEAKNKTEEAEDIEKIKMAVSEAQIGENGYQELTNDNLGSALIKDGTKAVVFDNEDGTKHILFLDEKKEYKLDSNGNIEDLNINFDTKYVAPSSQDELRNEGVIGIGTDGKTVDMDLWNWCYDETSEGYALNSEEVLQGNISDTAGYIDIEAREIDGTVPQYISIDNGKNYLPVTSLECTFHSMTNLSQAPKLPNTIVNMEATFFDCESLIIAPTIPKMVTNMHYCFGNCYSLEKVEDIPGSTRNLKSAFSNCKKLKEIGKLNEGIETMRNTFSSCISLEEAPDIPNSVTDLNATFILCKELKTAPVIHENVKNFINTFNNCSKLQGVLEINADLTDNIDGVIAYKSCLYNACTENGITLKLTGKSQNLENIYNSYNNPNIALNAFAWS